MKFADDLFEHRVRAALVNNFAVLDAETRNRLSAIRRNALEYKYFLSRWLTLGYWVPAIALVVRAVLVASMIFNLSTHQMPNQLALTNPEVALELLANEGKRDDSDFYIWLDTVLAEKEIPNHAG